jgi:hypothetical protein
MPKVSITIEKGRLAQDGRITARSSGDAEQRHRQPPPSTESQNGKPSIVISARPRKAPSIINSPCAKAHGLGGLVDEHEAQRDQAVDAALRDTADDELQKLQGRTPGQAG